MFVFRLQREKHCSTHALLTHAEPLVGRAGAPLLSYPECSGNLSVLSVAADWELNARFNSKQDGGPAGRKHLPTWLFNVKYTAHRP